MRQLALKIAVTHCVFPLGFRLEGVQRILDRVPEFGGFGDVFIGTHDGANVAVKRLTMPNKWSESQKKQVKHESICARHC